MRALPFSLLFALLALMPAAALGAVNFSDVPAAHPYSKAIQMLKDAGVISGYPDGTFQPDKKISRAETLAIILKAAGTTAEKSSIALPFTDVGANDWFLPMVQKGYAMKKLKGYPDKTFRPQNPVTLPEALAMTLSFFKIGVKSLPVETDIYDGLDSHEWYAHYAQYAKNQNLIEPDKEGHVDAKSSLTRAQIAELLQRMRTVAQTQKPYDITGSWIERSYLENFWKIRHPADWEFFQGQKNSVLWAKTPDQAFFTRVWPAGARLSLSVVENTENLTAVQYFQKLKTAYRKNYLNMDINFTNAPLGGREALMVTVPKRRIVDAAISLPNKNFLVLYGEYGEAPVGLFFKKQLVDVVQSYQYVEKPVEPPKPTIPLADRLSTLRENILVEDKWKEVAPLFPDKKIIHTDAIGIGTGPVDYYFTAEANQTIKLERNSGTVLNIREDQTSAF